MRIPAGIAAHIHATSGAGKVIVDPSFTKIDKDTYQSTGYNDSVNKVEITVNSGAGNASVTIKWRPGRDTSGVLRRCYRG